MLWLPFIDVIFYPLLTCAARHSPTRVTVVILCIYSWTTAGEMAFEHYVTNGFSATRA